MDLLCFLLMVETWLSARVGGARSSLQRVLRGLLLAQPQVRLKASAEGAQLCLSFPGPREGHNFQLPTLASDCAAEPP